MNIGSDGTELPDPSLKATEGQEDSCARNIARAAFAQRSIKTLVDSWKVQPADFCSFLLFPST